MASRAGGLGRGGGKIQTQTVHKGLIKLYMQWRLTYGGIFRRLTESIRNIVPGWLQRYFNTNEDVLGCSADTGEVPREQENREDERLTQATEESSSTSDGRITPAPTVDNTEEPSATSTASSHADVPTRPSLHQSHLRVSMLESPILHHQLSMSLALTTSSSAFSLVKEVKDSASQHDDNSSTTSVFSSRASDKDIAVAKNTSVPHLWSIEPQPSCALPQHIATSSKNPAFNLAAFGTLSSSLGSSSILKTKQFRDSPCYPGKTTYGGAAAPAGWSQLPSAPYQAPVRRQMKAKQLNTQSFVVISLAPQRILQYSEKMSSPLQDAKKISFVVSSLVNYLDRSDIYSTDFQAKTVKVDSQYPPVKGPLIPKPIPIATNHAVHFKPSVTFSHKLTKTNQRIADKYKHNTQYEKSVTPGQNRQGESGFPCPNFSRPSDNRLSSGIGNGGSKTRGERTNLPASKLPKEEKMEVQVLSKISLSITSSSVNYLDRSDIYSTDFQAKKIKLDSQYPPVKGPLIPKPVSIATNHAVHFKPSVTFSHKLRKTNQRIADKYKHNTQYEKSVTPGQNRQGESGFPCPNFSRPSDNRLSSGIGNGGSKTRRERTNLPASKLPKEEKMEVPVLSKISPPITSSSVNYLDRSDIYSTDFQAKKIKLDSQYPPVKGPLIPKPVSIATNHAVHFKPSVTFSHKLRKTNQRIADKNKHNTQYEKSVTSGQNRQGESGFPCPNFSRPAAANGSGIGNGGSKTRRERTNVRVSKLPKVEGMEVQVLSKISPPITSSSLPACSSSSSGTTPSSPSPISPLQPLTNKGQMNSSSSTSGPDFRVSSPVVKVTEADTQSPPSSVPAAKAEISDTTSTSDPVINTSAQDITSGNNTSCMKKPDEVCEGLISHAKSVKEGNVLDFVENPGFISPKVDPLAAQHTMTSQVVDTKPAIGSFTPSVIGLGESLKGQSSRWRKTCLLWNKVPEKCLVCEAAKLSSSSWLCDTCLLQNKVTDEKFMACQTSELPSRGAAKQTGSGTSNINGKPTVSASGTGFGHKCKPAVGTWDCDTCLVHNKPEAIRCVACETPKLGTGVKWFLTFPAPSKSL